MVQVKSVTDRRTLRFETMKDIGSDLQQLASASSQRASGNWTPAQNVDHVAIFVEYSLDGFPFTAPLPLRIIGKMIKQRALKNPLKPGLNAPKKIKAHEPDASVTWEAAVNRLRAALERIEAGQQMHYASPMFGAMSHDDWVKLHCRHAELHLSFIQPES